MSIDWSFQVINNDTFVGFSEPGIAHFKGDRYGNLAREIIQNSLDARLDETKTVGVEFTLQHIPPGKIPGFEKLRNHIGKCAEEPSNRHTDSSIKAYEFFRNALQTAKKEKIYVLKISESHTKGMAGPCKLGNPFHSFLKASGQSAKSKGAGGSHGIGKNASLAVSDFRTIFVSTRWEDEHSRGDTLYVQGKTTLTTHSFSGDRVSHEGFWGKEEGCLPLENPSAVNGDIPDWLERDTRGSSIFIIGFQKKKHWAENLTAAVAQNFFSAILRGKLEVTVDEKVINKDSLHLIFGNQRYEDAVKEYKDQPQSFKRSQWYYECLRSSDQIPITEDFQHYYLGHCQLKIRLHDEGPKKVAVLRNDMLITDGLTKLKTFQNMREFSAVLECLSSSGNEYLRELEPPRHNDFEPEELSSEKDQKQAVTVLKTVAEKVRELLSHHTQDAFDAEGPVQFIADMFEDEIETGRLDNLERDPEGALIFQPRPIKNPTPVVAKTEDELGDLDGNDGEGDIGGASEAGDGDGGDGGFGPGDGDGSGGAGDRSGSENRSTSIELKDVRHINMEDAETRLIFTPTKSGETLINVAAMGADLEDGIKITETSSGTLENGAIRLPLTAGRRIDLSLKLERECEGGLLVSAREV